MFGLEITLILILILINGFFSAAELAVVAARKMRLQALSSQGDKKAGDALRLVQDPNRFLATVQLGITFVGTLASAFGGARVALVLQGYFEQYALLRPYSTTIALTIVVLAITYLSIVMGELVPKRLVLLNPESHTRRIAKLFLRLSALAAPAVRFLTWSSHTIVKLLIGEHEPRPEVTQEEIEAILMAGTEEGVLEKREEELLHSVLALSDTQVRMIMVPRTAIVGLEAGQPLHQVLPRVAESHMTRLPVYRGDLDHIVGIVHIQDLISLDEEQLDRTLETFARPALYATEGMSVLRLLETFKRSRNQMAIVLDEYGGTAGMVTLEDALEEIVGDLSDEYDKVVPEIQKRGAGLWLVDGLTPIDHIKEELDLEILDGEEDYQFETVGGFVTAHVGDIPRIGDAFDRAGYRFEVARMEKHRVAQVMVSRLPQQHERGIQP